MPIKETTTPPVKRTFEFTPNNSGATVYDIVLREHAVCFMIHEQMFVIFDDSSFGIHSTNSPNVNKRRLIPTKNLKITKIVFEEI